MADKFSFYGENIYRIFILKDVEKKIENLKEKNDRKKILSYLDRLLERIPNTPEQWRKLEGCQTAYELKVGSYRLGCFFDGGKNILIVHFWKIQSNKDKIKQKNINMTCTKIKELKDEFKGFTRKF
jgi:mRNA-degrading endonuclease RelE of RelBE toxin-antitoxin system